MTEEIKTPCDCGTIAGPLNDPTSGLRLDDDNTFTLGDGWVVRHCPFCGGRLPKSNKSIWFPRLTAEEKTRLELLVEGISTADEAIERLGPPDYDALMSWYDSIDGRLVRNEELSTKCRNIEYYHLSEHANVEFYFDADSGTECRIEIKYISPRHIVSK